jgi:hypothetical protein
VELSRLLRLRGCFGNGFFWIEILSVFSGGFCKKCVFWLVFAGEVVVNCWWGRGFWMAVFLLRIYATFLRFIFAGFPFWEFAKIRSGELVGFWDVD